MVLLRVVDEQVDLVLGVVKSGSSGEKLFQEWDRFFDENSDDDVRYLLEVIEIYVLLSAASALKQKYNNNQSLCSSTGWL